MTHASLDGWVPIRFYWEGGEPRVDWCRLGERRFTEPFHSDTIEKALRLPFHLAFRRQTSVETLRERRAQRPGIRPTGFVFHMSRCGSTLAAQMLAALPANVVLSEASPIDSVLRANLKSADVTDEQRCDWLRAMVAALGQPRAGAETRLFVKFDSWHVLELPLIRRAFPDTPWIFLHRDPVEVLVSQMRQRGSQMVPGVLDAATLGIDLAQALHMAPEEYCAHILGRFCQTALDHHRDGGRLVPYRELPDAVWTDLAGFFATPWSEAEIDAMKAKTRFDAKTPSMCFSDDRSRKQSEATDLVRRMAATWVEPAYAQLEAVRRHETVPEPEGERGASAP